MLHAMRVLKSYFNMWGAEGTIRAVTLYHKRRLAGATVINSTQMKRSSKKETTSSD
jgi:hypothetical protein